MDARLRGHDGPFVTLPPGPSPPHNRMTLIMALPRYL